MAIERTFVMVKPDGVERGLVGEIVSRLERKGFVLEAVRSLVIDDHLAQRHYAEHREKPFFSDLVTFITEGRVVAMVWSGEEAVSVVRSLIGATDPRQADPGTIRGDLALDLTRNLIHGSDSAESAARELSLFFPGL